MSSPVNTFFDDFTVENLNRQPTPSGEGQLLGRRIKMDWKTARTLAISVVAAATIALKVYNLAHWNSNPLDVAADVGLGVEAALLLPPLTSPEVCASIMNMIKRYSLEVVMVLTQVFLNVAEAAPPIVFKQTIYAFFNSLLGALTTDNLITAFTCKQADSHLGAMYSESDTPLPMLTGDAKSWKHLLILSAIKITACAGLLIPQDEHKLWRAGGLFLGFNVLGEVLSRLITEAVDKEKKRIIESGDPHENPSWFVQMLNNFVTFNQLTHPIFIALANTIFPRLLPNYNIGIGFSGWSYGLIGHLAKVHFQYQERFQFIEEEAVPTEEGGGGYLSDSEISREDTRRQAEAAALITSSANIPPVHHAGKLERHGEPSASQSTAILYQAENWTGSLFAPSNEASSSCFQRTWNGIKANAQGVWNSAKATAAKVKNYARLRIPELGVVLAFYTAALGFLAWGVGTNDPTDRDIIALSTAVGLMILSYLFAQIISSTCDPSTPKNIPPHSESTLRRALDGIKEAVKNTLYHNVIDDQTAFFIFYLMLTSVNVGSGDIDFQDTSTPLFVAQAAGLACYGVAQGLNRVKLDRLNRFAQVQVPDIVMSILTKTLAIQFN